MARHDERFKRDVVQAYLSGIGAFKALGRRYSIAPSLVTQWVGRYRQHGELGLRKKFRHYSADFKLSVLQQMRDQELSLRRAVVLFDLRDGARVVSGWQRRYDEGGLEALGVLFSSTLHHLDVLDDQQKLRVIRSALSEALSICVRLRMASLATAVLQGVWRLEPDAALAEMKETYKSSSSKVSLQIYKLAKS